jgi:hypothetical protein
MDTEIKRLRYRHFSSEMDSASASVGYIISLKKEYETGGEKYIRNTLEPYVAETLRGSFPRVHRGYSTLLWFTLQVLIYAFITNFADHNTCQ